MIEIVRLKKLLRQYLTGQKAPDNDKKFLISEPDSTIVK